MIKILTKCPVCDGGLKAVKLKCDSCGTVIENNFDFPSLMKLSNEQMDFVEVFLRSRGNIKDVEKELGISYPTVRAKLDQIIEAIGGKIPVENPSRIKEDVLQKLEDGLISPDDAIKLLNTIK